MNEPLPARGKANVLAKTEGVQEINCPSKYDDVSAEKAIICVVDNGMFDAAGYAYCEAEFEVFKRPDMRPKRWFLMDKRLVNRLTEYNQ